MTAGLHVPVIPFDDVPGRAGGVLFWHNGPIAANIGVTFVLTVIFKIAVVAH
jgi:hypothetical protein